MTNSIQTAKDKFKCVVKSIMTGITKNMEKMYNELREDDPSLVVYCSLHWLKVSV